MKKNSAILLQHILDAIESTERIVGNIDLQTFIDNEEKCLASVRLMEIIGEAASQLKKVDPELFSQMGLQPSVGMRHVLIHDYDQVDMAVVWKTIHENLPVLKQTILDSGMTVDP